MHDNRHSLRLRLGGPAVLAVLALALLAPWFIGQAGDSTENRRTAAFPDLRLNAAVDRDAYQRVDAALRDRLGLRTSITSRVGRQGLDRLGTSLSPQVYAGEDGWLFLTTEFTLPCQSLSQFDATATARRLDEWASIATQNGRQLLFSVAPDKTSILRGRLGGRGDDLMACSDRARALMQATWGRSGNATVQFLWDDLSEAEHDHPGEVYQRGDTHWTELGALTSVARIVRAAGSGAPTPDPRAEMVVSGSRPQKGDLYSMLGFTRSDRVPALSANREAVRTSKSASETPSGRGLRGYRSTSDEARLIEGRTLVVHDSFGYVLERLLAPFFTDIQFLHWTDFESLARQNELPAFDRMVFESAERLVSERSTKVLADPEVDAAVRAALAR